MNNQVKDQATVKTYKDERVANMLAGKKSKMFGKHFEVVMQDNGEWAVMEEIKKIMVSRSRQRTHEITLTLVSEDARYFKVKHNGTEFRIAKSRVELLFQNEGAVSLKVTERYFQHRPELVA